MAVVAPSSPGGLDPKPDNAPATSQDPPSLPSPAPSDPTPPSAVESAAAPENPNPNPIAPLRPPSLPSFRPLGAPPLPHLPHLGNPNLANSPYQVPGLQPPGVSPPGVYHAPGQYMAPNGYMAVPPPGVHRYPAPYHPGFPLPPGVPIGAGPPIHRPPIPGIRGVSPLIPTISRPAVPFIPPAEKPQTTVYVGKIASTVGNDFIDSVLRLCGPVKSWKRAENPSDGTFRGFGFCEFESAEGVLRSLRLLNKFNIDGQDLVLNVNQATREYLERYVEKKKERERLKGAEEDASQSGSEKQELPKLSEEKPGPGEETDDKDKEESAKKFGIVSDDDRDADKDALDKLRNMIQERIKKKPPPPPPLPSDIAADGSKAISEPLDAVKSDLAGVKDEEMTAGTRDRERREGSPFERARRSERSVEGDREKDLKRENEREVERLERGRDRERLRREREHEMKIRESERLYKDLLKDWEAREREKENQRQREIEREKERARERRREVKDQEVESDEEDTRKRRRRSSVLEEKRRKRQREKEEDMADVLHEKEEIREAKKREEEEQKRKEESKLEITANGENDHMSVQDHPMSFSIHEEILHASEETVGSADHLELKQESNAPSRKLGFGLAQSGKRATVLPVFHQEDENMEEKKMRPLIPIDYSAEEMQATPPAVSDAPSHLAAAAEFAKRISGKKDSRREREEEEKRKLLDAKQLIDMIPKTKDKLFSYQINWDIYDKHGLHERMRPWISKKITEFLGEEETTLVDYIVSSTMEHVRASEMLEMLQSILDDEAEMFVLKMWRMLIFEIKKVETGLAIK